MLKPDLHTHTNFSDGALSPKDLVHRAVHNGVTHLAITDHDTTDAYRDFPELTVPGLTLVPGVELSARWMKIGIHIVGLNIHPDNAELRAGIALQQNTREERAQQIATRLRKLGLPDLLSEVRELAGDSTIGRPHFAQCLVKHGHSKDMRAAFKKYLGNGKAGDVMHLWPAQTEVIEWITAAGGIAVLAHPARYKLTATKLRELVRDFCDAGGGAIEVVSGSQTTETTNKLAVLANEHDLFASCGSDFHHPDNRWADLGKFAPLPADVTPVWEQWITTA